MGALLTALSVLFGLGSVVCFVLVVVKMFQTGQSGVAIASLLLLLACGIGALVAFIYGWMNAARWRIENIMWAWTGCVIGGIAVSLLSVARGGAGM